MTSWLVGQRLLTRLYPFWLFFSFGKFNCFYFYSNINGTIVVIITGKVASISDLCHSPIADLLKTKREQDAVPVGNRTASALPLEFTVCWGDGP